MTGIDPNAGQRGLTRNVIISGAFTNWQSGVTSVSYGAGVTVNSNVVNSATTLTTNITIDAAATIGPRDVVITTGTEALTVTGGFLVTDADTTPPALLTVSPPYGTTGVPLNPGITAEFNEPLDRTTVTSTTFQLYDTLSGQPLPATVTLDATGRVARLVPSQLLAVSRRYLFISHQRNHRRGGESPRHAGELLHHRILDRHHRTDAAADEPPQRRYEHRQERENYAAVRSADQRSRRAPPVCGFRLVA